jgi:hypothetical protein
VLAQPSDFHVVLGDPTTRESKDGGAWVPVDQVVAFPRRRPLSFEKGGGCRVGASHLLRPSRRNRRTALRILSVVGLT